VILVFTQRKIPTTFLPGQHNDTGDIIHVFHVGSPFFRDKGKVGVPLPCAGLPNSHHDHGNSHDHDRSHDRSDTVSHDRSARRIHAYAEMTVDPIKPTDELFHSPSLPAEARLDFDALIIQLESLNVKHFFKNLNTPKKA
jgi:hypothetical protein